VSGTKKREPLEDFAETIADMMAANGGGVFKDTATILDNIATSQLIPPPNFSRPTDEQLLYARVKHAVRHGQRRELPKKWERYLRADAAIKAERAKFKRLPNGAAEDVFQAISDDLKGTPYAAAWKTIRKDYYWIVGRIRKATAGRTKLHTT
jgi:hypothetical protein